MKKFLTLLVIGIYLPFMIGCEDDKKDITNNNDNQPGTITPPNDEPSDYDLYLEELSSIVNVEKYKIFERYGDFTEETERYLYLGSYPGREITNTELISNLNAIDTTNEFGYIKFENLEFIRVTIENTYDSLEIGDQAFENSTKYQIGTTHYFLVEPILWRVLTYNPSTKQAFLITNNIIDAQKYVDETSERFIDGRVVYPSNYEYSDVRNWCNNVFFNQAFDELEQEKITLTTINNLYNNYNYQHIYDRNTEDYVYIPSFKEITTSVYGFESSGIFSYSRFSTPSDYASAKGVYTSNLEEEIPSSGLYLLRTGPEFVKSFSYFVKFDGYALNPYYVNSPSTGVRLCVNATIESE